MTAPMTYRALSSASTSLRQLPWAIAALGAALAVLLASTPSAYAGTIQVQPDTETAIADGLTLANVHLLGQTSTGGTYTVSGGACADIVSSSNPSQVITSVWSDDGNITFYARARALHLLDMNGNVIGPVPPCAGDTLSISVAGPDTGTIVLQQRYPTGDITAYAANATELITDPAVPFLVLDGDGASTGRVFTGNPEDIDGSGIVTNGTPSTIVLPGTVVRATLLSADMTGIVGSIVSSAGTSSSTFATDAKGHTSFAVMSPLLDDTSTDVTNTLVVWTDVGDARSSIAYRVLFLRPGYLAKSLLEVPFENSFGEFSLGSRSGPAVAPTTDLTLLEASSDHAMKDRALTMTSADLLVYDNTAMARTLLPAEGTMAAWVSIETPSSHGTIHVIADKPVDPASPAIYLDIDNFNRVWFHYGSNVNLMTTNPLPWAAGQYHYLTATWTTAGASLYVDGVLFDQETGTYTPPLLGDLVQVGTGLDGEIDQVLTLARALSESEVRTLAAESTIGAINASMQLFSTVGFQSGAVIGDLPGTVARLAQDAREEMDDQCYDILANAAAGEAAGAARTTRCLKQLTGRPYAPVRVAQCYTEDTSTTPPTKTIVPCDVSNAALKTQADSLYTAAAGAQQFGGGRVQTGTLALTTDVVSIPAAGFPIVASTGSTAFAAPISTRFRLPPRNIPDLVVCNFPGVAGQEYDFTELDGYIFEDRDPLDPATHYGDDAAEGLRGRFKCPTTLAELLSYRAKYRFVLRDNTNQVLTRDWTFRFRTTDETVNGIPTTYAFKQNVFNPLNDIALAAALPYQSPGQPDNGRLYFPQIVTSMNAILPPGCNGVEPDEPCSVTHPIVGESLSDVNFNVTSETGLFSFALPADYTRIAAVTLPAALATDPPRTTGYVVMKDVSIRFAAPGASGDASSFFDIEPFSITYEIQPSMPSILADSTVNATGYCATRSSNPLDPDFDPSCAGGALQMKLSTISTKVFEPVDGGTWVVPDDRMGPAISLAGEAGNGLRTIYVMVEHLIPQNDGSVTAVAMQEWYSITIPPASAMGSTGTSVDWSALSTAAFPINPTDGEDEAGIYRITVKGEDIFNNLQSPPTVLTVRAIPEVVTP